MCEDTSENLCFGKWKQTFEILARTVITGVSKAELLMLKPSAIGFPAETYVQEEGPVLWWNRVFCYLWPEEPEDNADQDNAARRSQVGCPVPEPGAARGGAVPRSLLPCRGLPAPALLLLLRQRGSIHRPATSLPRNSAALQAPHPVRTLPTTPMCQSRGEDNWGTEENSGSREEQSVFSLTVSAVKKIHSKWKQRTQKVSPYDKGFRVWAFLLTFWGLSFSTLWSV